MPTASGHTSVIRAKKVLGTTVKNQACQKIGIVEDIVLNKLSNNIVFAAVSFGGFLGLGEKYHPLPWTLLKYDDSDGNYVVNATKEQLEGAPAYELKELTQGAGAAFRDASYEYYKTPRFWS